MGEFVVLEHSEQDQATIKALYRAIDENRVDWVREKLGQHANLVNAVLPSNGWLGGSVSAGHVEMTQMLIRIGCDVNESDSFGSLLELAVSTDRPKIVQLLMEHGAQFDPDDRPTLLACRNDNAVELLQLLKDHGVKLNASFENQDTGEEVSALSLAMESDRRDVVDFLSAQGCQLSTRQMEIVTASAAESAAGDSSTVEEAKSKKHASRKVRTPRKRRSSELDAEMLYLVSIEDEKEADSFTLHMSNVDKGDADYLRHAAKHLQSLSDEQYMTGPAVLLLSMAKSSYVLSGKDLYWCVEWTPGLVIVRVSPEKPLAWVGLAAQGAGSPNLGLTGLGSVVDDSTSREIGCENERDRLGNPQYNLIFDCYDAQQDTEFRESEFVVADVEVRENFQNALSQLDRLADTMETRFGESVTEWFEDGKQNLKKWLAGGVSL